jgi:hypothetical protein
MATNCSSDASTVCTYDWYILKDPHHDTIALFILPVCNGFQIAIFRQSLMLAGGFEASMQVRSGGLTNIGRATIMIMQRPTPLALSSSSSSSSSSTASTTTTTATEADNKNKGETVNMAGGSNDDYLVTSLPPLNVTRDVGSSVLIGHTWYVIGRRDNNFDVARSCESLNVFDAIRYQQQHDKAVANGKRKRGDGGKREGDEGADEEEVKWLPMASMSIARPGGPTCAFNNHIYVFAGENSPAAHTSAEVNLFVLFFHLPSFCKCAPLLPLNGVMVIGVFN